MALGARNVQPQRHQQHPCQPLAVRAGAAVRRRDGAGVSVSVWVGVGVSVNADTNANADANVGRCYFRRRARGRCWRVAGLGGNQARPAAATGVRLMVRLAVRRLAGCLAWWPAWQRVRCPAAPGPTRSPSVQAHPA